MFCPICRVKVKPDENDSLKQIVREKAKEFAKNYNLKELIQQKNFAILDVFTKLKKLEDNCKFCPTCKWTPFSNLIADSIFKKFKVDFSKEIQQVEGTYLLDYLFSKEKKGIPKKEIQDLLKKNFFKKDP